MLTVNLDELINEYDEEEIKSLLCCFSCPRNKDLQDFLCNSSIEFSKRNVSKTYLIINEDNLDILAYFSLAFTSIQSSDFEISKTLVSSMDGFNKHATEIKVHLIGQIGKNFAVENNPINLGLILQETFTIIKQIRAMAGGRFAILECNNNPSLIALYKKCGFKILPTKEDGDHLITMCIKIPD